MNVFHVLLFFRIFNLVSLCENFTFLLQYFSPQSRTAQVSRKLIFVQINVLDSNDERPELLGQDQHARYTGSVREDADSGVLILRFSANDRDSTEPYRTVSFLYVYIKCCTRAFFFLKCAFSSV